MDFMNKTLSPEEHGISAGSARNEAEEFRKLCASLLAVNDVSMPSTESSTSAPATSPST